MTRRRRNSIYRRKPGADVVRPVPLGIEDAEMSAFLSDIRRRSGGALAITDEKGRELPVRLSGGSLEYYTNGAWVRIKQEVAENVTKMETTEEEEPAIEPTRTPSSSGSYTVEQDYTSVATLDDNGKLLASQLPSHTHTQSEITDFAHTHTKSDITDFPTGYTGTITIGSQDLVFVNGILTEVNANAS